MKLLKSLYLNTRFFLALGAIAFLFAASYLDAVLFPLAQALLGGLAIVLLTDLLLVYRLREGVFARREATDKLSNGDDNPIDV